MNHHSILLLHPRDIAWLCDADLARRSTMIADYRSLIVTPTIMEWKSDVALGEGQLPTYLIMDEGRS